MPVFCDQAGGQRRDERLLGLPGCNAVRETCSGGILDMRGVVHRVGVHIHLPLRGGGRPQLLLEHAMGSRVFQERLVEERVLPMEPHCSQLARDAGLHCDEVVVFRGKRDVAVHVDSGNKVACRPM